MDLQRVREIYAQMTPETRAKVLPYIQRAFQPRAEAEIRNFVRRLGPQDSAAIDAMWRQGGWPAVREGLAPHLSEAALEVLTSTVVETGSLEGVATRVVEQIRGEDAEIQARAEIDGRVSEEVQKWQSDASDSRGSRSLKANSPIAKMLRDPGVQQAAVAWYLPRREMLKAAGLELGPGETPLQWILNAALAAGSDGASGMNGALMPFDKRYESSAAIEGLAEIFGSTPGAVKVILQTVDQAETTHELLSRLGKHDDESRKGLPPRDAPTQARITSEERQRHAYEAKYDEMEAAENARQAEHRAAAERATAPPPPPAKVSVRESMERAYDGMTGEEHAAPETAPDRPASVGAALSSKYDSLSQEGGE